MENNIQSLPASVLQEAQKGVENAQVQGLPPIQQFVEKDNQSNQQYLFVLSSDRNDELINSIPEGMALVENAQKQDIPPTYGEKLGVVDLAELPYVVFRVIDGHPQ